MEANEFVEAVLKQLRAEMGAQNISGAKLAEQSGVPYSVLVRYLRGEREIPVSTLFRVLDALGLSAKTFVSRVEDRVGGQGNAVTEH